MQPISGQTTVVTIKEEQKKAAIKYYKEFGDKILKITVQTDQNSSALYEKKPIYPKNYSNE